MLVCFLSELHPSSVSGFFDLDKTIAILCNLQFSAESSVNLISVLLVVVSYRGIGHEY